MPSSSAVQVVLSDDEREQLERWTRRRSSAQALALRARIVLLAAAGLRNTEIAQRLGISRPPVTKWRNRFVEHRLDGLSRRAAARPAARDRRREGRGGDRQDAGEHAQGRHALVDALTGR